MSGDLVEMSWEPCACGLTTAHIGFDIARCASVPGNEHAIGPASVRALAAGLAALDWPDGEVALIH